MVGVGQEGARIEVEVLVETLTVAFLRAPAVAVGAGLVSVAQFLEVGVFVQAERDKAKLEKAERAKRDAEREMARSFNKGRRR